ncbi:hypothetical protein [Paenibacillus rhizophilus]|uniref:Adhesin domain-containing protein n=1 Tax=Paenibacillus rhizophilus TaxID=1850366 RepID=A0A3N9P9Z4_9BACL|nr:hypothetical protein [Paenibacillus rhizophilus]RQW13103.1 hypothetical protein EH198_01355 [Paenibacillus rhizophilus]
MIRKFGKMTAAAALAALLLAGCTELPGKTASGADSDLDNSIEAIGETVQQEAGKAADSAQQAVENTASDVADRIKSGSIVKELSITQSAGSADTLRLDNSVGEIEVKAGTGSNVKVTATIRSYGKLFRKADRQQILDNAEVSLQESGGELQLSTHPKNDPDIDLWTWAEKRYGFADFSISYAIEVPDSLSQYEITGDVGKIKLRGLTGTFHVSSDVGGVDIEDVHIAGKSTVSTDTGSISLDINAMDAGLTADTDVGSISAALGQLVQCTLEANSELGRVSGAPSGKSDVNGGGPLLSLSTSVGSINVTK